MFKSHIKLMVLEELHRGKKDGYDLMKEVGRIGEKRPSPGYMYPLLNDLRKRGLISLIKEGRKKIYSITPKGDKLLISLRKQRKTMLYSLKPLMGKEEIKTFFRNDKNFYLKNKMLLNKFYGQFFYSYTKDERNREKLREIVQQAIKKMEGLS